MKTLETSNILDTGIIVTMYDNIIIASGLEDCFVGETINLLSRYSENYQGMVMNLEDEIVKIIVVRGNQNHLASGQVIYRTFDTLQTKSGFGILGQIITPLGEPLNEEEIKTEDAVVNNLYLTSVVYINSKSPTIIEREPVTNPFLTGIVTIDCFIPIGCGQRELIIGDINTGKTSLAVSAIINQSRLLNYIDKPWRLLEKSLKNDWRTTRFMPCIFVSIGKKRSEIVRIKNVLLNFNAMRFTSIVFTSSDDFASIQYLAPYAGSAIGEWFRDKGWNSLIIFDDLSTHAVAYRQISLLLRRPPGREAYPGDIFYIHSRLLERASQLSKIHGGGSMTALPIVETQSNDISAYVATNIISITDGQVFLSPIITNKGIRPGVDIGLSVSRVGSKAQYECMKYVSKKIKRDYTLFKAYESLTKLGSDVDPLLKGFIDRGLQINKLITQNLYETKTLTQQSLSLFCLSEDCADNISPDLIHQYFDLFFSGSFFKLYLNDDASLLKYFTTESYSLETLFLLGHFSLFKDDLLVIFKKYNTFFKNVLEPRLIKSF